MSPYLQVRDGVTYPPTMLLHGTADTVVPYRQSVKMHKRLVEHGVDSRLVLVDGAEHEHDFWSPQVFDMIFDFIRERCGDNLYSIPGKASNKCRVSTRTAVTHQALWWRV